MSRAFDLYATERTLTDRLITILALILAPKIALEEAAHRWKAARRA